MSDEWSSGAEAPRKKGGMPRWLVWTCGIGCVVALLLGVGAGVGGYFLWQQMTDPEIVHPRLMKLFQSDTWPEGYRGTGASFMGSGGYSVEWPGGMVMVQAAPDPNTLAQYMDPDSAANALNKDFEEGEVEIQGRMVPMVRFTQLGGIDHLRVNPSGDEPPWYTVDLIGDDRSQLDPAQLEAFLAPFDVWIGED